MKFCTKCGAQMADETRFCTNCGNAMNVSQQPNAQPQQTYAAPPQQAYARPQQSYQQAAGYNTIGKSPVKTDYSLLMYILLSIVTCGIYGYYIIYKLAHDVNQTCAEDGDNVGGLGAYILLSVVTCGFYSVYWMYKIQNRLHANAPRYNVYIAESGTTVLMWYIIGMLLCGIGSFVAVHIMFKSANKVGMAYNAKYFRAY